MSGFRGFFQLFFKKGINLKDAGRVRALQCADVSLGALRHAVDNLVLTHLSPSLKTLVDTTPISLRPNINPGTGYGTFHVRGLHESFQASQMSQQDTQEAAVATSEGEVIVDASASMNEKVEGDVVVDVSHDGGDETKASSSADQRSTMATLTPVVPGMPTVRRGVQVAPVGVTLSISGLIKEMTDRIRKKMLDEAIQIYREWLQCIDPLTGQRNKPLLVPCNIALLAEGLKGAPVNILMKRVEEMGRIGLSPNIDTFYVLFNAAADGKDMAAFDHLFGIVKDLGIPVQGDWCIKAISTITALGTDMDVWKAMEYVRIMVANNLSPDDFTISRLVAAFARTGQAQKATDLVRWGQKKEAVPSIFALGGLLQVCVDQDVSEGAILALDLLFGRRKGKLWNVSLDEGTLLAVLSMAARTGDLLLSTRAWDVLMLSLNQQHAPSQACYLARLHAAVTGQDMDLAIATLQGMEKDYPTETNTDVFSPFTSLSSFVLGCARGGTATLDAVYFKLEGLAANHPVPLSAINCVILGCSNVWDIDRAYQTFEAIRSVYGFMPNIHSSNSLIEGFAKMKKVPEALKVYEFMIGNGIHPDRRTFELLVKAHIVNRDTKAATQTVDQMSEAGFTLTKEMALKLRRRFIRECDDEGARNITRFKQKFNYADGFSGDTRRAMLFPFTSMDISTKMVQARALA